MLNIFELNRKRDERELKKYNIYNQILAKCHVRIQLSSEKNLQQCLYNIPNFVPGLPCYDSLKCAEYLVECLRKNGFQVTFTYPSTLYIDWRHVPSNVTNPYVEKIENDMVSNPYRDYSRQINMITHLTVPTYSPQHHNEFIEDQYNGALITKPIQKN